mmetsp:Transcript_12805/g.36687  ORF Transcript_12805/g.36687 Transcript_12805/m.36687 type:complete len:233 (+) Transcript_12805:1567-2265(+)
MVQVNVRPGRSDPRKVLAHITLLQLPEPLGRIVIRIQCPVEAPIDASLVGPIEDKRVGRVNAVRLPVGASLHLPSCLGLVHLHVEACVRKPSRSPNHRHRTIPHGNHLSQTTRLEHRRHQHKVCRRVDEVAKALVEVEYKGGVLASVLVGQGLELGLDLGVGGTSEQHILATSVKRLPAGMLDEMGPLLLGEPGDTCDDRLVSPPGESKALSQGLSSRRLALQAVFSRILDR